MRPKARGTRLTSFAGRAMLCRALARFAREDAARSFGGLPVVGRAARVSSLPLVAPPARSFRGARWLTVHFVRRQSEALPSPHSLRSRGHRSPVRRPPFDRPPASRLAALAPVRRRVLFGCIDGVSETAGLDCPTTDWPRPCVRPMCVSGTETFVVFGGVVAKEFVGCNREVEHRICLALVYMSVPVVRFGPVFGVE